MKLILTISGLLAAASAAVMKRDCAQQPAGTGLSVHFPDTPQAFWDHPVFFVSSITAFTPTNFTSVFINLRNSTMTTRYLGLKLLNEYSTSECAQFCTQNPNCASFNIYFERDPSQDPNSKNCPNPSSVTNIKCAIWGTPVTLATVTNSGQKRGDFQTAITGSNGYNFTPNNNNFFGIHF